MELYQNVKLNNVQLSTIAASLECYLHSQQKDLNFILAQTPINKEDVIKASVEIHNTANLIETFVELRNHRVKSRETF